MVVVGLDRTVELVEVGGADVVVGGAVTVVRGPVVVVAGCSEVEGLVVVVVDVDVAEAAGPGIRRPSEL